MKEKSSRTWEDAVAVHKQGRLNTAANRFYYAVFQAVYSYAVNHARIAANDESGLHGKMRKLVKSIGRQPKKYVAVFDQLLALRTQADYQAEDVESGDLDAELIENAENLRLYFSKVLK